MTNTPGPSTQIEERFRLLVEGVKDYAIFMLDPEGRIATWNAGARKIKGYEAAEIIGRHFSVFYPPDAIAVNWPQRELELAVKEGRFEDEGWRLRKDGSRFWANVVITALYDDAQVLRGFAKVTRDLTERRKQEQQLRESEERFRLLVEGVKDYAIFMLDPEGRIMSWNAGAEKIKGYAAHEIIGQHFSVFYPLEVVVSGWPEHELEVAKTRGQFEDEGWRVRKDRSMFWANVVISALYDNEGRLRGFSKVTRDMTERKRVEALEHGRQQMNEFLAMLAHELRNPLAPIRNAVHIMSIKQADAAATQWCRGVIDRQVSQLTRLVDDLLDITRITSGKIVLHKERLNLNAAVQRAVESTRPLIEARRHTLTLALADPPIEVDGDMVRLSQAILNLLNNAAKYTPERGAIWCTVSRDNGSAVLSVRDNGVGIGRDLLPKVFELFVQGDSSLDRSEGGLGVGLTLVDRLVRLHGGSVHALSGGPGLGSEFVVRLPALAPSEAQRPLGRIQMIQPDDAQAGRRVLIVEDNRDSAETLALAVRSWGHQAQLAHDGVSALVVSKEFRPDVVLIDVGLPKMNGYELARQLRKLPGFNSVLLVAVTGYGAEEDRERSHEAGIDHHFAKPVDLDLVQKLLCAEQRAAQD
jgi:PAS domain S-box-containing protein